MGALVDQNKKEGYKYNILRIQRKGKGNKYLEITKKMKPIIKISKLLNQRLQFLESLFLISSYQQLVTSNTNSLIQKHKHMQKDQIDTVTNILRAVRIDDVFKKQLHGVVLKVFLKVEAGSVVRQQATGAYKDIIADYLSFFGELKEKYIVDFIKQIFQLHIYNQTTVIYVLVQLLLKFLRIKCMSFITDRIEPKLSARQTLDPFSYLMLNQNDKKQHRAKAGNRHRNVTSPLSQINKRNISQDSKSSMSENFQIKSKTIGFQTEPRSNSNPRSNPSNRPHRQLHSASDKRQTIHHSVDASPSKPKRRIIKSYKDIQEQTKQKIMNRNIVLARQSSYSASRPYARMFLTVFREQWNEYLQLAGMREISDEEDEPETGVIKFGECSTSGFSNKRKLEWYNKNKEKVVVEACSRNDQIRRQMQNYSQSYSNKLKK